ncbi:MAG: ComF family protein [Candidatus Omnitrophica bacterium]|nr:ComF family protein [Candidatus Omnitrophota bacterium]HOX53945.1 ComF family protein [Candidatus Omnitrophota bacterium]
MLKTFATAVLDLVYPNNCINCKTAIIDQDYEFSLCPGCWQSLEKNLPPFCSKCGMHLEEITAGIDLCKDCQKQNLHFDKAYSVFIFEGIIKELIHKFKYSNKTMLAKVFAQMIFDFTVNFNFPISEYDIMLPVPLNSARLREREYNQCEILARQLHKYFPLEISTKDIVRIRNTKSQISLDKTARWKNIDGAFKIKNKYAFVDKKVLIIDDLITTGATASELAKTLKGAGVKMVSVLTIAKAK